MNSLHTKIDRATAWIERENARSDKALRSRPDWWHIGKILFGILFVMRSVAIALNAQGLGRYALASLWLIGGAYLAYEGFKALRARRAASRL